MEKGRGEGGGGKEDSLIFIRATPRQELNQCCEAFMENFQELPHRSNPLEER